MRPYIGLVHKDPDSAYGITFPDAPGCFSAADDLDELFVKAEEALAAWAEAMAELGCALAPPRGLEALRRDPEWAESFGDVALVIAIAQHRSTLPVAA